MGTVVCVTSGKGGTGKTSVAVGVAVAFARRGKKTLLLELDIGLRGIDLFFGFSPSTPLLYDLGDLLLGRCELSDVVTSVPAMPHLSYLPGPLSMPNGFEFGQVADLIKRLQLLYDIIIIDTSAGLGLSIMVAVQTADLTIVVTTPDPVCVRAGAKVTSLLEKYECYHYRMIINKVRASMLRHTAIADLDEVMDGVGAPLLGVIPEDDVYRKLSYLGNLPPDNHRITRIYEAISRRIEGDSVPLVVTRLFR